MRDAFEGRRLGKNMKCLKFSNLSPLIPVLLVSACSSTATLHLVDGTRLEARITRSDETSLYVGGCRHRTWYNDVGKVEMVELHCDSDEHPEARQVFMYENKFDLKEVRLDICGDSTVDKRMIYVTVDERNKIKRIRGDPEADNELDLDTIKGSHCYKEGLPTEGAIPRAMVREIDHPGNIQAAIGAPLALAGWGVAMTCLIYWWAACDQYEDDSCDLISGMLIWYGIAVAVPTTILGAWGWNSYFRSKDAAKKHEGARVIPLAMDDGHRAYYGLGFTFNW